MGISVEHRRLQPHDFQQVLDLFLCLSIIGCLTVKQHWLGDRIADFDFGVQAGVGILKDHLYLAAQATLFAGRYFEVRNVLSLIKHLPGGGGRQREDRSGQRGRDPGQLRGRAGRPAEAQPSTEERFYGSPDRPPG